MNMPTATQRHSSDKSVYLPATGTWPSARYLLDSRSQDAIALAVACGRPLLVRGLPGTGKSDLARAAAEHLQRAFVYEVVTARTEPQDLLWRFDAIGRLADAQAQNANDKVAEPKAYVSPGVMWWAINWEKAKSYIDKYPSSFAQCPDQQLEIADGTFVQQHQRAKQNGCVLLLDEIDKADSELPNSLLEVLANTSFRLPWGDGEIKADENDAVKKPLIMITTNEDRELPAAFVRRCLVLTIEHDANFEEWIKQRARVHFRSPGQPVDDRPLIFDTVLDQSAQLLMNDRENLKTENHKPGLAEYLDLLRGLCQLAEEDEAGQLAWLQRVSRFAYDKHSLPER